MTNAATTEKTFTGYENQGFVAFMHGASSDANPWVRDCAAHAEWLIGHANAAARAATGQALAAPNPIYTVKDLASARMDAQGFRVSFVRLGANWSLESAEEHAKGIRRMGRLAEVLEITPAEQLEIFSGAWDGHAPRPALDAPITPGAWGGLIDELVGA